MKLTLSKKPKGATIIEGFPGFGLVGPIVTEYLLSHLKTEQIGEFTYDELPATIAIHEGKVVNPMAVHYNKEHNIIIFHTILAAKGHEWTIAQEIDAIARELKADEIICLEGVNAMSEEEGIVFSYGNPEFVKLGAREMKESVIMGVSAALLLRSQVASCLFAQAKSNLPDSAAAANIITFLDKYLGLDIDPEPLKQQAEQFEQKLKGIMTQASEAQGAAEKKNLEYLG